MPSTDIESTACSTLLKSCDPARQRRIAPSLAWRIWASTAQTGYIQFDRYDLPHFTAGVSQGGSRQVIRRSRRPCSVTAARIPR